MTATEYALSVMAICSALAACSDARGRLRDDPDAAPRFDDAGEPLPPRYDAGPAPSQPCAEGIRRVFIDIPSHLTRERRRIPRIVGDGTSVLVADVDETSIDATILGRLSHANALTGEVAWTTTVELPLLSTRGNPPAPVGIRRVDGGWEVAWARAYAPTLAATVRFADDGTASAPVSIGLPPDYPMLDVRSGTESPDGFLITAQPIDEGYGGQVVIAVAGGSATATPLDLEAATNISWGPGWIDDGELSHPNAAGEVVGIFREYGDDGSAERMVVTSFDRLRWDEPFELVTLAPLASSVWHAMVVAVPNGTVAGVTYDRPAGFTLQWLDDELRERARADVAPSTETTGTSLIGAVGSPPWQAVALAHMDVGIDLLFGIVRDEGDIDGVMRPILSVPERDPPHTAVLWSSEERVFHVGWWRGDLEVLTISCAGSR